MPLQRYPDNFGFANAGFTPTFLVFRVVATLQNLPFPSVYEDGGGWYHFEYDWSTAPAGPSAIEYTYSVNGAEIGGVITGYGPGPAPAVTAPSTLVGNYTTDTLLADIRKGAMLPAASELSFDDVSLLRLADREMQTGIVPLLLGVREEYFITHLDQTFTPPASGSTISFRVPYRAVGGKLRDVCLLSSSGAQIRIPQIGLDGLELGNTGWYPEGNLIVLFSPFGNWQATSIRMSYSQRPNQLVSTSAAAVIQSINPGTNQVTLAGSVGGGAVPASFTSSVVYDFVKALPGYDCLATDQGASIAGPVMTFASLPSELAVGDYVALAGQTPVPQVPPDIHPILAQRVICKALESLGDAAGLQAAKVVLGEMEHAALPLITPRVDGEPRRVVNRNSPFRRRRRMLLY